MDNNNINQDYNNMNDYMYYNDDTNNDVFSNRYDNDFNRRFNRNYDLRYDNRFDNRFDRRYDRDYYDRMRYYQYPYCDRYGRCENPIWWLFWPLFFM